MLFMTTAQKAPANVVSLEAAGGVGGGFSSIGFGAAQHGRACGTLEMNRVWKRALCPRRIPGRGGEVHVASDTEFGK